MKSRDSFIDETIFTAVAGRGGDGIVAFRREKFVPRGGPNGGDGGRGGDVVIVADGNLATLWDQRYRPKLSAGNGADGGGSDRTGADGVGFTLDALFESQPWISGSVVDLAFNGGLGLNTVATGIGAGSDWLGLSLVGGFEVDFEAVPFDIVFEYRPNLWLLSGLSDGGWNLGDNLDWFAFVLHVRVYPFPAGPDGSAPPPG